MRFVSIGECMIEMAEAEPGNYKMGFAGDTLNTAWYARALLPKSHDVDYVTALGTDTYSDRILAFFTDNGIGTGSIRRVRQRRPGLYLIHQADGDRHFTYWRGQSAARQLADDPTLVDQALAKAEWIYFSGITLAILKPAARMTLLKAVAAARSRGARIAFDPNVRPSLWKSAGIARSVIAQGAATADIVLPTFSDDCSLFGDASPEVTAVRYLALGASQVVVKDGSSDALFACQDRQYRVPPRQGIACVDPTGAGDSFNGAYLAAVLQGVPPVEAMTIAHAVAAKVIGHQGALLRREALASP